MRTIFRKELADYFDSWRVFILFLLVLATSAAGLYAADEGIRGAVTAEGFVFLRLFTTQGEILPPLTAFITLLIPIIGISLGFDAINREYSSGTMSRILAQPLFRDSVINGKFLAGIVTLSIMVFATVLIVFGAGLSMIGVPPTPEEIIRLFIYLFFVITYGAFWMGLAILFSVLARSIALSLLASIAVWLFFSFFYTGLIIPAIAKTTEVLLMLARFSPQTLFTEVTTVLLLPEWRGLGLLTSTPAEVAYMIPNPLSLGQSLLLVWPHLTSLLSLTIICFAVSYVVFMRQEIRAT